MSAKTTASSGLNIPEPIEPIIDGIDDEDTSSVPEPVEEVKPKEEVDLLRKKQKKRLLRQKKANQKEEVDHLKRNKKKLQCQVLMMTNHK